jgi:hypothetical protein
MEYAATRLTTEVSRTFKPTHVKTLIDATYSGHASMSELFRVLSVRLRDERWICIFKALSLIHLLTREGNSDRVLGYLCGNPEILNKSFYQQQGFYYGNQAFDQTNWIKTYASYLEQKAASFRQTKFDWIRNKDEAVVRLRTMEDVNELLKLTDVLQKQIDAAIECKWEVNGMSDIVLQQGFRLMMAEMIGLFHLANEANVRILSLYFEMERSDAVHALEQYKKFTVQTKRMQEIFDSAKQNRHSMSLTIPVFKAPPASLATTLEDYINAPDFEQQRRAHKEKKSGKKGIRF